MKRGKASAAGVSGMSRLLLMAIAVAGLLSIPDIGWAASRLDSVRVVPNPYNVSGRTFGPRSNSSAFERILFTNLPVPNENTPTKIKVYSMTLDLVAELEHSSEDNQFFWDGRNSDNQYVVSGIYYYVVEHPDYGSTLGKLVIIR
jgi:hypothetical protein